MSETKWTIWHTLGLFVTIVVDIVIAAEAPTLPTRYMVWTWIANMFLFLVFVLIAGHGITGMLRGLLIDSQNTMSLSRLQMILWTILILAGYLAAVITNIHRGQPDALGVIIHPELWALMGIRHHIIDRITVNQKY